MKNSGQTLLEVVIALSAILITLAAISIVITTSVGNSTFIKNQGLSSKYAQQGVEYVRYLRNNNYQLYKSYVPSSAGSATYCLDDSNVLSAESNCNGIINLGGSYIRSIVFEVGSGASKCNNTTQVTVSVKWKSNKCTSNTFCHKSELISCFSDQGGAGL